MSDGSAHVAELTATAVEALLAPGVPASRHGEVPAAAGLYALHAADAVWQLLGLTHRGDRPLYIGKAERSLRSRDVATHFAAGKTGSSTVRRSFAALLRDELTLEAQPRNPRKPGHFSNYGLSASSDERLSTWMAEHLSLAWWAFTGESSLCEIEVAVIRKLQPPLNLTDVREPLARLKAARSSMAADARAWATRSARL